MTWSQKEVLCPRQPSACQCLLLVLWKQIESENENRILDESNKGLMTRNVKVPIAAWPNCLFVFLKAGCPEGTYGSNCQKSCKCMNGGHCDPVSGTCDCAPRFIGADCSKSKPVFMFCFFQKTVERIICVRICQYKNRQIAVTSSLNCKLGFQLCKNSLAKYFPSLLCE